MNMSALFIRRPVMTSLVMLAIMIFGTFAYQLLAVNDLPTIDFPTIQVRASLPQRPFQIPPLQNTSGDLADCIKGERPAFSLIHKDYISFTVYDRSALFSGAAFNGPAIVEERESTIVIGEDARAAVNEYGFVWIDFNR